MTFAFKQLLHHNQKIFCEICITKFKFSGNNTDKMLVRTAKFSQKIIKESMNFHKNFYNLMIFFYFSLCLQNDRKVSQRIYFLRLCKAFCAVDEKVKCRLTKLGTVPVMFTQWPTQSTITFQSQQWKFLKKDVKSGQN